MTFEQIKQTIQGQSETSGILEKDGIDFRVLIRCSEEGLYTLSGVDNHYRFTLDAIANVLSKANLKALG